MKAKIANMIIKNFQLEDLINILLNNNYVVELKKYDRESSWVTVYETLDKEESEEE